LRTLARGDQHRPTASPTKSKAAGADESLGLDEAELLSRPRLQDQQVSLTATLLDNASPDGTTPNIVEGEFKICPAATWYEGGFNKPDALTDGISSPDPDSMFYLAIPPGTKLKREPQTLAGLSKMLEPCLQPGDRLWMSTPHENIALECRLPPQYSPKTDKKTTISKLRWNLDHLKTQTSPLESRAPAPKTAPFQYLTTTIQHLTDILNFIDNGVFAGIVLHYSLDGSFCNTRHSEPRFDYFTGKKRVGDGSFHLTHSRIDALRFINQMLSQYTGYLNAAEDELESDGEESYFEPKPCFKLVEDLRDSLAFRDVYPTWLVPLEADSEICYGGDLGMDFGAENKGEKWLHVRGPMARELKNLDLDDFYEKKAVDGMFFDGLYPGMTVDQGFPDGPILAIEKEGMDVSNGIFRTIEMEAKGKGMDGESEEIQGEEGKDNSNGESEDDYEAGREDHSEEGVEEEPKADFEAVLEKHREHKKQVERILYEDVPEVLSDEESDFEEDD
jgi:hypothetical protein